MKLTKRMKKSVSFVVLIVMAGLLICLTPGIAQQPFKGIKLTIPLQSLPSTTFLPEKLPQFEKETGMKVELQFLPEIELWDKIVADFATGAGVYNVVNIDFMFIPEFAEAGWILPIDDYITPDYQIDDIMPKYLQSGMYEGKIYGFPVYGESTALWYRKDLFKEAGINPPATFYELWDAAVKFYRPADLYGIALRGMRGSSMNVYVWTAFLRGFGGDFFDKNWNPVFNSSEGIYATKFYRDLINSYGPPGGSSFTWDDTALVLMSGKVAMIIEATDFVDRVFDPEKSKVYDKLAAAPVPAGPAGRFPSIFTSQLSISKVANRTDKQIKASWAFISWATSKEMELKKALEGKIPTGVRRSVFENSQFKEMFGEKNCPGWLRALFESLEVAEVNYRPRIKEWREIGDRLGVAVEDVIAKIKPADVALNEAAEFARETLKRSGRLR